VSATLVQTFTGAAFARPVDLVQHPSLDDRWYVVENDGVIRTLLLSNPATSAVAVDVNAYVTLSTADDEDGLLGLVFDPGFAANGIVYVSYLEATPLAVEPVELVIARYRSMDQGLTFAPIAGDPAVLRSPRSSTSHIAGDMAFGPDGFLYVSMGDGRNPDVHPQDLGTLLGKILRIDVSVMPYRNPPDNPFVGSSGLDEIWAYGFRNPWRMSFDSARGDLWLGDVGENSREEIDLIVKGANYGWPCVEGDQPYSAAVTCRNPLEAPKVVHPHPEARSITGGYVYRGTAIRGLAPAYVYGDFISGRIWAFHQFDLPTRVELLTTADPFAISSFAQDRTGEIYVVGINGKIWKLSPTTP
jgi:glucose/arabinose dehydrogenase